MIQSANEIVKKYFGGDEELGLLSLDPLKIEKFKIVRNDSELKVDMEFRRVELKGFKNATIYKISGFQKDPECNKLDIRFKTPLVIMTGPFTVAVKLLILPIEERGNVTVTMENLDIRLKFLTKKVIKEEKVYMKIEKAKLRFDLTR